MSDVVLIHTDGASRGNPGPAAIGAIIRDRNGKLLAQVSQAIGVATNNQAEYRAVIAGLEKAHQLGATGVRLFSDSELVVRQLQGRYRVKNAALKPLFQRAVGLAGRLEHFSISYVPREQNTAADRLTNRALDAAID
jgi:ribonuclease HI